MSDTGWTDARVDALKTLWLEGLSASQVAHQLGGVTRNAVIGKVHRLGLSGRAPGISMPRPKRAPRLHVARAPAPPRLAARPEAMIEAPDTPGLVLVMTGLGAHVCKWPIGDPLAADFSFCGRAADGDGPYCGRHDRRAHQPRQLAPLDRDPVVRRVLAGLAA